MKGYVYILQNEVYPADMLKIGMTARTVYERAIELFHASSGIPLPFTIAHQLEVANCAAAEELIHLRLHNFRYASNREFFKLNLKQAIEIVDLIAADVNQLYKKYEPIDALPDDNYEIANKVRYFHTLGSSFSFRCIKCNHIIKASLVRVRVELCCPQCMTMNILKFKTKAADDTKFTNDNDLAHLKHRGLNSSNKDEADFWEAAFNKLQSKKI